MANVCLVNAKSLGEEIVKWAEKPKVKAAFRNPYEAAFRMVDTEFLMSLDDIAARDVDITKGQLKMFKSRLSDLTESIEKGTLDNKFATTFWQTSHYGKKDPIVGSVLRNMQLSNFYFRSNESNDKHLMREMLKSLENESISRGIVSRFGLMKGSAQKRMQQLDDMMQEQIVKYKNGEADIDSISKISGEIDSLVSNTYLSVYDDLIKFVEGVSEDVNGKKVWKSGLPKVEQDKFNKLPKKEQEAIERGDKTLTLTESDLRKATLLDGTEISSDMFKSLVAYKNLMDGLYSRLRNGVNARLDGIVSRMEQSEGREFDKSKVDDIKDRLRAKMMPSYRAGFFPHYTRDLHIDFMDGLMPLFDEVQSSANPYSKNKNTRTVRQILDSMSKYIDGHTIKRSEDYRYSRNFLNSITNYIYDVNRFNYLAFMDKHTIDGLISVERIYKTDSDAKGYGQSLVNYIESLHTAANGDASVSPKTRALMRTLLSFEFISKLGVNPRGAVRNFTQRLLDYVEWGPRQVRRSKEIIDRLNISESDINSELNKVGLLFEDISPQLLESDVTGPASTFKKVEYDETANKYKFTKKSRIEKIADKMGWAAGKSSFLHRKAENSNRKHTFKVAFAQMYDWLDTPKHRESLLKKNPEYTEKQINGIIKRRARNYATNMVVLNHFDYAEYAKSRLITTKAGKFLGQFQHYSFEFFERNMKILREAKGDVLAGKLLPGQDAQGLSKAYRMAIAYFAAPVVASALTGVDFSNLVEHDTATRLKQFATSMVGDEEEIEEAFYGKGPIISTFGGPLVSDLIDIGTMLDLIDMDDDSRIALIGGMEKRFEGSDNDDLARKIRLLNTFAGRAVGRHIPQLTKGRIGWSIQQELGLYPTAESRKIQKQTQKVRSKILPEDLEEVLKMIEQRKS